MHLILMAAALFLALSHPNSPVAHPTDQDHCLLGCPKKAPATNTPIDRSIYLLSNNPDRKFADWVAYKVNQNNFTGPKRTRVWKKDPDLNAADTITPIEYDGANEMLGVDRGHQAPLAAFKGHADWAMTNFLSNITPQSSKLNQGPWKKLEAAVRKLAEDTGKDVFVMTGPLYEWLMLKLPATDKDHRVPSSYWKIVAIKGEAEDGEDTKASGFYFYQDIPKRAKFCDHMTTIGILENKTGLEFFPELTNENGEKVNPKQTLQKDFKCP